MTGVVSSALSCLDIAMWDIQGKAAERPVAGLLGGAKATVPAYVTFGFPQYDRDQLVEAAKRQVAAGYRAIKLVVGRRPGGWREDAERVRAVRDAVGDAIDVAIDANYMFTLFEAKQFCRAVEDCRLAWFEEPLQQNDTRAMADLRRNTRIPVAAGQNEGHRWRLRALIEGEAVDILQPNVSYCGGFTEARKAAHLAQAYNMPIANGGSSQQFNLHLMAGMANGIYVEWHLMMAAVGAALFEQQPEPVNGEIAVPDRPGLGLAVRRDVLKETLVE